MLSSRIHSRHPTWPPTVQLLPSLVSEKDSTPRSFLKPEHRYTANLPEIAEDEDPFSHFLSPVLEEESPFEDSSYTAGITPYESSASASRRDAFFRARLEEKWETFVARRLLKHSSKSGSSSSIPAPLPPPFPQEPSTPPGEEALPDLLDEAMDADMPSTPESGPSTSPPQHMQWYFPSTIDDAGDDDCYDLSDDSDFESTMDGWEADRRRSFALRERHRREQQMQQLSPRKTARSSTSASSGRTLSGKRHAWRVPSPGLWTVEEEDELVDQERRGRRGRKRVKTVRWNEEVTVLEYER